MEAGGWRLEETWKFCDVSKVDGTPRGNENNAIESRVGLL